MINCGQHRDEGLDERHNEEAVAVIDKNGMDIEAIIREMSKTKVEESGVALAKHLIKMKRGLQTSLLLTV